MFLQIMKINRQMIDPAAPPKNKCSSQMKHHVNKHIMKTFTHYISGHFRPLL